MNIKIVGGNFKIIKPLGCGSFGNTYLAEDLRQFRHQCVVKQLKFISWEQKTFDLLKKLFKREAKALYELGRNHDQIPSLLAYFEEKRQFYLVQEFISGYDLTQELTPGKQLPESQVIQLLKDILKPLAFLHQKKIIHRDIKPSNLMRRKQDGKIILIDFGAIKQLAVTQLDDNSGLSTIGTIIGTPGYMPNEQAAGKAKLSSDVYAVGIIAIQALTGLRPQDLDRDRHTGELRWSDRVQMNPKLKSILEKMVLKDWLYRYKSASEVLAALRQFNIDTPLLNRKVILTTDITQNNKRKTFADPPSKAMSFYMTVKESLLFSQLSDLTESNKLRRLLANFSVSKWLAPINLLNSVDKCIAIALISFLGTVWISTQLWLSIVAITIAGIFLQRVSFFEKISWIIIAIIPTFIGFNIFNSLQISKNFSLKADFFFVLLFITLISGLIAIILRVSHQIIKYFINR
ncbi:MAG: serine/threonine-protein kinase [Prochloraceae cyanobacterium]|nr:serine/threonine-protein kinase [Prochloraceae cyanobacterium]